MTPRTDISDNLIHFTSGETWSDAFLRLQTIINQSRILGSSGMIRGGFTCVCFTEAPLSSSTHGLVNVNDYSRYSPFGVMFKKEWIFERGGRPVIYQPEDEFDLLPESLQWRHVRYEPVDNHPIDFTWEREWRICIEELNFTSDEVLIVVPSTEWANQLVRIHESEQNYIVQLYGLVMDEYYAEIHREPFTWGIVCLTD